MSREDILLYLLFSSFTLFLTGFLFLPNAVDLYKFYSVAVLLPALLLLPRGARLLRDNTLFLLIIVYLGYMMLTPVWGEQFTWPAYLDTLRLALYVIIFLMVAVLLGQRWPQPFTQMLRIVSLLAAVAALISLVLWLQGFMPGARLEDIGIFENPNASGYVYAVFAVMNLASALDRKSRPWLRALHLLAFLVLLGFVLFTYSRGALLSLVAACLVFFTARRVRNILIAFLVLSAILVLAYFFLPQLVTHLDRGVGVRPEIWKIVLSRISEAPIFGYGYLSDPYVKIASRGQLFAHNAYLASLRDGGLLGAVLMFAMLGYALYQAWPNRGDTAGCRNPALLVLALVCMLFDTDRLVTRPRELWLVLWFPLALILNNLVASRKQAQSWPDNCK